MKKHILYLLLTLLTFPALAQLNGNGDRNNLIKWNPLGLVYNNIPLTYERVLTPQFSAVVNASTLIPSGLPTSYGIQGTVAAETTPGFLWGFGVTPEFRWYVMENAPDGFYISPYFRYSRYTLKFSGQATVDNQTYLVEAKGLFREIGGGAQFGYQWTIKEQLAIDFFFFGPRISRYLLGVEVREELPGIVELDWTQYAGEVEQATDDWWVTQRIRVENDANSLSLKWPFTLPSVRLGVSVGYRF